MEKQVLSDPEVQPDDAVLASHLGEAMPAFLALRAHVRSIGLAERWNYYKDGHSWLFNVSKKKGTVFWLGVEEGFFRVAFYFTARAEQAILGGDLPEGLKRQYLEASDKKLKGLSVVVRSAEDLEAWRALLAIRLALLG